MLNETGQIVHIPPGHFMQASIAQGTVAGLSGQALQDALAGDTLIPIYEGVAQFTNLAIMAEAQGLQLQFDVRQGCCQNTDFGYTLGGLQAQSAPFGVYGRVQSLVIKQQPTDTVAGQFFNNTVQVELRDRVG